MSLEAMKIFQKSKILEEGVKNIGELSMSIIEILNLNLALISHEEQSISKVLLWSEKEHNIGKEIT